MKKIELYRQLVEDISWSQVASRLDGYNIRTFVKGETVISFMYGGLLNKNTKVSLCESGVRVTEDFSEIVANVNKN